MPETDQPGQLIYGAPNPPIRILLVDDRPENLLVLEASLRAGPELHGPLELVRAMSGPEALRAVLQYDFAVILLDVQMPGMDGFETASLIRSKPGRVHTPIIFLTAVSTSDNNVFRGYSLGAVDYLFKPFEPEILRAKIAVFVDLHRKTLEIERMASEVRERAKLLRETNEELAKTNKVLGALYHELEAKTEEMRRLNENLELRVIERTRELRQMNDALRVAKESAEMASQAKDQFLAVLSHELRTPLTPALAIVQMFMEDPTLPADAKGWVATIGRNIELEARLIDDLLDLTRISKGKLPLHLELTDAHRAIEETAAMCMDGIHAKNLELMLSLEASNAQVDADPARLKQVLWNLIKNAIKFTPEGGNIEIRTESTPDGGFRCNVTDTGIGIPPSYIDRVFNAFDQGDNSITRRFGGLGLGLAISKALVEQHGGKITVASAGNEKGTTFTLEFPPVTGESRPTRSIGRTSELPSAVHENSPQLKVLLVEDNEDTSRALQVLLERAGYRVLAAHSAQAALEIAKTYPCEILISDISLPDGNGIELFTQLSALRPTRGIAMSGFGMPEDIRRSLQAGFHAHLVKPVSFRDLRSALDHLMMEA
ncbi:MAG: response regulator [Bacteroidota bacterium]|nr:response regulator [Bacteroidota bacterium]